MGKIWLIIQREYLSRVKTKSFILSTILVPLTIIILMVAIILIAVYGNEKLTISVKDESGLFENKFRGLDQGETLLFKYDKKDSLDSLRAQVKSGTISGVLYIPKIDLNDPKGIKYYGSNQIGPQTETLISNALSDVIKSEVLKEKGYDQELLKRLNQNVSFETIINGKDKTATTEISSGIGYVMGFAMYMFIFIYGAMVMKGVAEEKTSRIVEVMLSSIKPIQLMAGKLIGIGLVAFTQTILWIAATAGVYTLLILIFSGQLQGLAELQSQGMSQVSEDEIRSMIEAIQSLNLSRLTISFLIYFILGFLFYGSQFAAVGAAVTDDTDANSYTMPIVMPIIIAMALMGVAIQQPGASVAVWGSMIPWFSPVVMPARIPFDVSIAQLALSIVLLGLGTLLMLWLAGRIYRVGILTQGKKVSFKDLGKWIFSRD